MLAVVLLFFSLRPGRGWLRRSGSSGSGGGGGGGPAGDVSKSSKLAADLESGSLTASQGAAASGAATRQSDGPSPLVDSLLPLSYIHLGDIPKTGEGQGAPGSSGTPT